MGNHKQDGRQTLFPDQGGGELLQYYRAVLQDIVEKSHLMANSHLADVVVLGRIRENKKSCRHLIGGFLDLFSRHAIPALIQLARFKNRAKSRGVGPRHTRTPACAPQSARCMTYLIDDRGIDGTLMGPCIMSKDRISLSKSVTNRRSHWHLSVSHHICNQLGEARVVRPLSGNSIEQLKPFLGRELQG